MVNNSRVVFVSDEPQRRGTGFFRFIVVALIILAIVFLLFPGVLSGLTGLTGALSGLLSSVVSIFNTIVDFILFPFRFFIRLLTG